MTEQEKMKYGYYRDLKKWSIGTLRLLGCRAKIAGWESMRKSDLQKALWENYMSKN